MMKRKVTVLGLVPEEVVVHTFSYEAFPGFEFAHDGEDQFLCISPPYAVPIRKSFPSGLYGFLKRRYGNAEKLRAAVGPYLKLHRGGKVVFEEDFALVPTA
ncbi:MAG: hypothetical protein AAFW00_28495 [Bacteroidota bacterium]